MLISRNKIIIFSYFLTYYVYKEDSVVGLKKYVCFVVAKNSKKKGPYKINRKYIAVKKLTLRSRK